MYGLQTDERKAVKAGRSMLADHILGTRRDLRRYRVELAACEPSDLYRKMWLDAAEYMTARHLRDLRDIAAEFRGK